MASPPQETRYFTITDVPRLKRTDLNILYCNARSFKKEGMQENIEDIVMLLENIDCLVMTETWLEENTAFLTYLNGYDAKHIYRTERIGGGVSIWARTELKMKKVEVAQLGEILPVTIEKCSVQFNIIGVYNNKKANIDNCLQQLTQLLKDKRPNTFIIGDFNVDRTAALDLKPDKKCTSLKWYFDYHGYKLCNKLPTRKTALIDHIYTNSSSHLTIANIDQEYIYSESETGSPISDHNFIILSIENDVETHPTEVDSTELIKYLNEEKFIVGKEVDINKMYQNFIEYVDKGLTNSKRKSENNIFLAPWMDEEYKEKVKIMYVSYSEMIKARKDVQAYRTNKKQHHYSDIVSKEVNLGIIKVKGGQDKLVDFPSPIDANCMDFLPIYVPDSSEMSKPTFFLNEVTLEEIQMIMDELNNENNDRYYTDLVKKAKDEISPIISFLINKSFKAGEMPELLVSDENSSNYIPISTMSAIISNIIDMVICKRLLAFLFKSRNPQQYAFQKNTNKEIAATDMVINIEKALAEGKCAAGLFLDFNDTVSSDVDFHKQLIEKLSKRGVTEETLRWFQSYLKKKRTLEGVSQRPILTEVLFLILLDDIEDVSLSGILTLYAGDSSILCTGESNEELITNMQQDLRGIQEWMECNKLSITLTKINYMIYRKRSDVQTENLKLHLEGITLERVPSKNFLGLQICDDLSWYEHTNHITKEIEESIDYLKLLSNVLNESAKRHVFIRLVESPLNYMNVIWCNVGDESFKDLNNIHEKALRGMYPGLPPNTKNIFNNVNHFSLKDLSTLKLAHFGLPVIYDLKRSRIKFSSTDASHRHDTRSTALVGTPESQIFKRIVSLYRIPELKQFKKRFKSLEDFEKFFEENLNGIINAMEQNKIV